MKIEGSCSPQPLWRPGSLRSSKNFQLLFLLFFLTACTGPKDRVRIRGEFENLPQADLLLYSPDGGLMSIDTLHIVKGRFDYETRMEDSEPYTFTVVYPNYMTLSFMAHAGADIRIKGDALSLAQVSVEGADSILPQERKAGKSPLAVGRKLPKSKLVRQTPGTYLLLSFWANWKHGSSSVNYYTRLALAEHPDSLRAFSYSLDVSPETYRQTEAVEDSTKWKTYCDFRGWNGPLLTKYGIRNIPFMILVDPQGRVAAMGSDYTRDIKPRIQKVGQKS